MIGPQALFPLSVFSNAQAMPPSPPTTTPKFGSGRSANASLWSTTTYPTNHPKLKVQKGAAPLSLRSGTTIVPNRHPKSKVRKRPLRKAPLWATTINPHQPPYVESSERCRSAIASLRTTIVPTATLKLGKGFVVKA